MKGQQMDLLAWKRPTAVILSFPIDRETRLIRDTARQLDRRSGKSAEKFWRTECNRLHGRLQARGMARSEIEAEVDRFARAVSMELERGAWLAETGGDAA